MQRALAFVLLILISVSCSDFFKRDVVGVATGGGGNQGQGSVPVPLPKPEDAIVKPEACEHGELAIDDKRRNFIWSISTKRLCPQVSELRYNLTMVRFFHDQACAGNNLAAADVDAYWARTIKNYQYLVANSFGPLQADMGILGTEIYAWPEAVNIYAPKIQALEVYKLGEEYVLNVSPDYKGLAAIDALIANKNMLLEPGPRPLLNETEAKFNGLPIAERTQVRCRLLSAYLNDVAAHTETLYKKWSATEEGNFPKQLVSGLNEGKAQMYLSELVFALYYMETVKDDKLGIPLGINIGCTQEDKCPDKTELRKTGLSLLALEQNIAAFNDGMRGVDGQPGFKHLLEEIGRADLAAKVDQHLEGLNAALKRVQAVPPAAKSTQPEAPNADAPAEAAAAGEISPAGVAVESPGPALRATVAGGPEFPDPGPALKPAPVVDPGPALRAPGAGAAPSPAPQVLYPAALSASASLEEQILAVDSAQCLDTSSPYPVCQLFFEIKALMEFFKSDFMSALDIELPEGETDGD